MRKNFIIIVLIFTLFISGCDTNKNNDNSVGSITNDENGLVDNNDLENSKVENYTKELSFMPIGDGNEYAVSVGEAKYLSNIVIPNKYNDCPVTIIAKDGFYECSNLEKITFPSNLKRIEDNAFYNCDSLREVILPDTLEYIGKNAFYSCSAVEKIYVGKNTSIIKDYAFYYCKSIKTFTFNAKKCSDFGVSVRPFSFRAENDFKIIIGKDVYRVPSWAFAYMESNGNYINGMYKCVELYFEEGCIEVGEYAFASLKTLTKLTLPNTLKKVERSAFLSMTQLEELIIPKNIVELQEYAFNGCNNCTSIRYLGTKTEWESIYKYTNIFYLDRLPCNIVQCTNGEYELK